MKSTVFFDLYGTLISLGRDRKPYADLCREAARSDCIRDALTVDAATLEEFCEKALIALPANITQLQQHLEEDIASAEYFPDALEVLQELQKRGLRIAVVSNLATPYIEPVGNLGLNRYVDCCIYSCRIGFAKPDPRIYQAALDELNLSPSEVLMIGDSRRCDVDGPLQLGIDACQISRGNSSERIEQITSLNQVFQFINT